MNGTLFLSQASLDQWLEAGHVDMGQDSLIFTADQSKYAAVPAVRFLELVDGQDAQKLLGKVKAVEALRLGGAEISLGAVVLAETAYQVEEGFMLTVPLPERSNARPPTKPAPAKPNGQEADLLAQFILNKLS